jgi:hypothetical protein
MGNTIMTREHINGYDAYIHFCNPLTQKIYETLYEFGGLIELKHAVLKKYHLEDTLRIRCYGVNLCEINVLNHKDMKQVRVMHIRSNEKDLTLIILNEIRKMLKWNKNNKVKLLRPRTIVKCTEQEYSEMLGRHEKGIYILEKTECKYRMYIAYKKKLGGLVVCSENIDANLRVKDKIQEFIAMYKKNGKVTY